MAFAYDQLKARVEMVERELAIYRSAFADPQLASIGSRQMPRLARTVADSSAYPSDPATVYPIVFLDGYFTETAGNQTPTWIDHSATFQRKAFSLATEYLDVGTIVQAWRQNGKWWIMPVGGGTTTTTGNTNTQAFIQPRYWWEFGPDADTEDTTNAAGILISGSDRSFFKLTFDDTVGHNLGITHDPDSHLGLYTFTQAGSYEIRLHSEVRQLRTTAGASSPPSPAEAYQLEFMLDSVRRLWAHKYDTDAWGHWSSTTTTEGTFHLNDQGFAAFSGALIRHVTSPPDSFTLHVQCDGDDIDGTDAEEFGAKITNTVGDDDPIALIITKIA